MGARPEVTGGQLLRAAIVAEARTWLGVPFRHQGRSRAGVDCAGLVIMVARALGLSSFDTRDYARRPDGHSLLATCRREMHETDPAAAAAGDVFCLRIVEDPEHLAIAGDYFAGGLSLVHAYAARPHQVIEQRLDPAWRARIIAAFRLPGVA
jgi:hypothetical protein